MDHISYKIPDPSEYEKVLEAFEEYFIVISNNHFHPNAQGKGGYKHPIYVKIRILNNSYTVYRPIQWMDATLQYGW